MMIQRESWRPRCKWCGKAWGKRSGCHGKPSDTPTLPGKCPQSLNGKHCPVWEEC